MFNLRCTKRLLHFFDVKPEPNPQAPTTALGDWYANLVSLEFAGDMIVFANERSLLSVAIPLSAGLDLKSVPELFRGRVANLLYLLNIPVADIERELAEMDEIRFAKTASRKVLGSLNDICFHYDAHVENRYKGKPLNLSEIELNLADLPSKNLPLVFPDKTAHALLVLSSAKREPVQ